MEAVIVALIGALATIAAAMITTRNTAKGSTPSYDVGSTRREGESSSARTGPPSVIIPAQLAHNENLPIRRVPPNPIASRLSWTLAWGMIGIVLANTYLVVFPEVHSRFINNSHNFSGFCIGAACGLIYGKPTAKSLAIFAIFPPLVTILLSFQEPFSSVGNGLLLGMLIGSVAGMFYKKPHRE
jgi:hypothetical protein